MISRILKEDPETDTVVVHHYDPVTKRVTIETRQEVGALRDANTRAYNLHSDYGPSRWKGDWHRVASIPTSIYFDLVKRGIADDPRAMKRWLNDNENQVFRTKPGRV